MTTDNTQELDGILINAVQNIALYTDSNVNTDRFTTKVLKSHSDNLRTVILDWHNKQIDKILAHDFFKYCQGCSCAAADLLEAERNKLKESNNDKDS